MTKSQTKTVRKAQHPIKSPFSFCSHFLPTWQVKDFWLLVCFPIAHKACPSLGLHCRGRLSCLPQRPLMAIFIAMGSALGSVSFITSCALLLIYRVAMLGRYGL